MLVAEDEDVQRELLIAILAHQGHTVVTAANGREALEELARTPVQVVLMDLQMPGLDGLRDGADDPGVGADRRRPPADPRHEHVVARRGGRPQPRRRHRQVRGEADRAGPAGAARHRAGRCVRRGRDPAGTRRPAGLPGRARPRPGRGAPGGGRVPRAVVRTHGADRFGHRTAATAPPSALPRTRSAASSATFRRGPRESSPPAWKRAGSTTTWLGASQSLPQLEQEVARLPNDPARARLAARFSP